MPEILFSRNFFTGSWLIVISVLVFLYFYLVDTLFIQSFVWIIPITIILLHYFVKSLQKEEPPSLEFLREVSGENFFQYAEIKTTLTITNTSNHYFRGEIVDTLPYNSHLVHGKNNQLLIIPPNETRLIQYSFSYNIRGKHKIGPILYRYHGANEREEFIEEESLTTAFTIIPKPLKVGDYPALVKYVRSIGGPFASKLTGEGWSFSGVRDYMAEDSMRRINWKATARMNELQTNEFELQRSAKVLIVLDLADEASEILERSISAALGLSEYLINSFCKVGMITIGKFIRYFPPVATRKSLYDISKLLTNVEASKISNRNLFLNRLYAVTERISGDHEVILFSSLSDERLLNTLIEILSQLGNLTLFTPDFYSIISNFQETNEEDLDSSIKDVVNNVFFADRYITYDNISRQGIRVQTWNPAIGFSRVKRD